MGLITRRSQVQILAPLRPTHRPRETPTYTVPARLPTDFEVDQPARTQDGGVDVTRSNKKTSIVPSPRVTAAFADCDLARRRPVRRIAAFSGEGMV